LTTEILAAREKEVSDINEEAEIDNNLDPTEEKRNYERTIR
jgi:hypothetical protein